MIQPVLAVIGDVEIFPPVVVVISHADALSPARCSEAGLRGYVGESSIVIVTVEVVAGRCFVGGLLKPGSVHQKNVRPAVIIVVEDRYASASSFDDVLLGGDAAENFLHGKAGLFGDIREVGNRPGWRRGFGLLALTGGD